MTQCVFPRGLLNGRCVQCPVDTLYEYVESYTYQKVGNRYWGHYIKIDQSYYNCVQECSPKHPHIDSNRMCKSGCTGDKMQVGHRKFCNDENINDGFCYVNDCPVHCKCYLMQCFTKCPHFTVSYNNSCLVKCFDEKPFILNGECINQCPEGYVLDIGVCQMTCSNGRFLFNKTCVDKCPRSMEYVDEDRCVSECPFQKLYQNTLCVNNCSEQFVRDGRTCKTECSKGRFKYNRICMDTCPDDTLQEHEKCVKNCSSDFLLYASKCLETCPPNHFIDRANNACVIRCEGFKYHQMNNVFCLNDCPEKTARLNSTCVTHCPKTQPFLYNKFCFAKCPVSSRFFELKVETGHITYVCVDKCKKYTSSVSNMCVDACSMGKVLFRETCQEQCPDSDPYKVHMPASLHKQPNLTSIMTLTKPINAFVICAKECPSNFVRDNGDCYFECPTIKKNMTFNMTCVHHCPEDYPFVLKDKEKKRNICKNLCEKVRFQNECLDKCPDTSTSIHGGQCVQCGQIGMYEENQHCVNSCKVVQFENRCYNTCLPNAKFALNGSCVQTCPLNASKIDEQQQDLGSLLVCMEKCPTNKFTFGNHCVYSCPQSKSLPLNGICTACHEIGKFDDGSICVDKCRHLHYEFRCVDHCPYKFKIYNKSCVRNCPIVAPLVGTIFDNYTRMNEQGCVRNCKEGEFIEENKCVSWCFRRQFIYNNTCVEKCPADASFISDKYINYYVTNKECLKHCKDTQYLLNFTCFEKCPKGFYGHKNQCIEKCPEDSPYINHGHTCVEYCQTLRRGINCLDTCPQGTYEFNNTCVHNCPSSKPYNYKSKCVDICPNFMIKKICYEQCPYGLVGYQRKCLLHCPTEAKYRYKWECFIQCPNNTILNLQKYACFDSCPNGKIKYQQLCYDQCPLQAPYYVKGECVEFCDGYLKGSKCLEHCPHGDVVFEKKCLLKCPREASFLDKNMCVSFCPHFYDNNFNCIKECPKNTFPHGKHCTTDCPQYLPFTNVFYNGNRECVERCDTYELATENYECISSYTCSGVIYDDTWCFQTCPSHTYVKRSWGKNLCISLTPVYTMIIILSLIILINIALGVEVCWHYNNPEQVRVFFFPFVTVYIFPIMCIPFSINKHLLFAQKKIYIFFYIIFMPMIYN